MIEQQLEERLRLAVADEPPLGFDPDDLVDRAFRRQRNRRATGAVVAAVAVLATAATITFGGNEARTPQVGSSSSAQPPTVSVAPGADSECQGNPPYDGDPSAVLAAMEALDPALAADYDLVGAMVGRPRPPSCEWYAVGPGRIVATVYAADAEVANLLWLSIAHNKDTLDPGSDPYASEPNFQIEEETTLEDGSLLRMHTLEDDPCGDGSCVRYDVVHLRTDGVVVTVSLNASGPERHQWIVDQLDEAKELAQDPRLTF